MSSSVTATAEPVAPAVAVQQIAPREMTAFSAGMPEVAGADMHITALPAILIWAIFRALVQKFGPVIAKEILCAEYGICW